jgi:hemerythrin superfamily protein
MHRCAFSRLGRTATTVGTCRAILAVSQVRCFGTTDTPAVKGAPLETPDATAKLGGMASRAAAQASQAMNEAAERSKAAAGILNAVDMLTHQHREAESLLAKLIGAKDPAARCGLFEQLADTVAIHMRIEEEIFYPAAHAAAKDSIISHGEKEHKKAKELMAEMLSIPSGSQKFAAKLDELNHALRHHHGEEENNMFPAVRKGMSEETLTTLGKQMFERQTELQTKDRPRDIIFTDTGKQVPPTSSE